MSEKYTVVGKRLPRWEGHDKASGSARYLADIKLPGMLTGAVLFSPHAHARIKSIDTSRAEKLRGVQAVVTFADMPKEPYNPNKTNYLTSNPVFEIRDMHGVSDKARFVGDRIAAVAAIDEETAQKALDLISVEYEVLPAVFDAHEAMLPDAPVVHDFAKSNVAVHFEFAPPGSNVESGFAEADLVLEETFHTARNQISQFEPTACIVSVGGDGRLDVWSPSQHVFLHRRKLAEYLCIPEGSINWHTPHLGGGFGKGGSLSIEPVCAVLAQKAKKPVKVVYSRQQDFYGTETRQRFLVTAKMGFKKDGTMTALEEKIITDGGAYFSHNISTTGVHFGTFLGFYRCPHVKAHVTCVYTNVPPTGGVRGYGASEAYSILEQMMDKAAAALDMDPLAMRLKNVKKTGERSTSGHVMENCTLERLLRDGAEKIEWQKKRARNQDNGPKRYGIGVAAMMDVSGGQPHTTQERNAYIKFNEDGSVNLIINACDIGQNLPGTISQIAAEVLGIHYEDVHFVNGDTDTTLFDTGVHASGGLYQFGNAVKIAAEIAKKQLLKRAALKLGEAETDLDTADREIFVKSNPAKRIAIREITTEAIYNFEGTHEDIAGIGHFSPKDLNPSPFAVVFAEVEVDMETGDIDLQKLLYLNDTGVAINPTTVEGQIHGGIMQAIGYCLSEDYILDEKTGRLITDNFNSYRVPAALDMPEIEIVMYADPVASGPFGAKAAGHGTIIAPTPAIANAVFHATGVQIRDMPITPERLVRAMAEAREQPRVA